MKVASEESLSSGSDIPHNYTYKQILDELVSLVVTFWLVSLMLLPTLLDCR